MGWLHTLNADLNGALDNLGYFAMPSTIIQEAATQMLLDKPFVTFYLEENQQRLARSYDALTGTCSQVPRSVLSPVLCLPPAAPCIILLACMGLQERCIQVKRGVDM